MNTITEFKLYVEIVKSSFQSLAKETGLNWLTVRKILNTDEPVSRLTQEKIEVFLNNKKIELQKLIAP